MCPLTGNGSLLQSFVNSFAREPALSICLSNVREVSLSKTSKLVAFYCNYNPQNFEPRLFTEHAISYPEPIKGAVAKRQTEFLAGRFLAKKCLSKLRCYDFDVAIGRSRNPLWPKGLTGTITHDNGLAICVIGHLSEFSGIGLDVETILAEQDAILIQKTIMNKDEIQLLKNSSLELEIIVSLVFSVKESIFKALFPSIGYYFDFDAVAVENIDLKQRKLMCRVTKRLSDTISNGMRISVDFEIHNYRVISFVRLGCDY